MDNKYLKIISSKLNAQDWQIENTIGLFEKGATIPFISRYRKENTGSLNEVEIQQIKEEYTKLAFGLLLRV